MRHATIAALLATLLGTGCDRSTGPVLSSARPPEASPPSPGASTAVASLRLQVTGDAALVGGSASVTVLGFDASGALTLTDGAEISISDPSVAEVDLTHTIPVVDARTGRRSSQQVVTIGFGRPGTSTLRVAMGAVSATVTFQVEQAPPSTAVGVDSFVVYESPVSCASPCPYVIYWPVLKVRETSGEGYAQVVAVEVTLSTKRTGLCRGNVRLQPGSSEHVNRFDPYPWNNDLILVSLDGTPVPDDLATARLVVRDRFGRLGTVEARTTIRRMVKDPPLPTAPPDAIPSWSCVP